MKNGIIILLAFFYLNALTGQREIRNDSSRPSFVKKSDVKWLEAMKKESHKAAVKKIINPLGRADELNDSDEFMAAYSKLKILSWYKKGLTLAFSAHSKKKYLEYIFFLKKTEDHEAFKGRLPFGFSFSDRPEDLKARYGKHLSQADKTSYYIYVDPENYPDIYFKISYSSVDNEISQLVLLYDTLVEHLSTPEKLSVDNTSKDCDILFAMVNDCDNKFFNFRGEKNKGITPTWKSRVKPDWATEVSVHAGFIRLQGYYGFDELEAGYSAEELFYEVEICAEENANYKFSKPKREEEENGNISFTYEGIGRNVTVKICFVKTNHLFNGKFKKVYYAEMIISHSYHQY